MSKAQEARIRDELLHGLYAATLRCTLHCAAAGLDIRDAAFAAGLAANLRDTDTLLLPARGGAGLRVLRGLPARRLIRQATVQEVAACVLQLPAAESAGVHLALGAAVAAKATGAGALVCVLLPGGTGLHAKPSTRAAATDTWSSAGEYAARHGLPLVFATFGPAPQVPAEPHLQPAPRYPCIPVDGADALAVYRVAFECAQRARAGMGPSRIAGVPFRMRGSDEDADGLARLETALLRRGVFRKAAKRQLERHILRELEA